MTEAKSNNVNIVFEADTDDPLSYEARVIAWMRVHEIPIVKQHKSIDGVVVLSVPADNISNLYTLLADSHSQPEGTYCVQVPARIPGLMSRRFPGNAKPVRGAGSRLPLNALPSQIDFKR